MTFWAGTPLAVDMLKANRWLPYVVSIDIRMVFPFKQ
jgi:hypothetical protein